MWSIYYMNCFIIKFSGSDPEAVDSDGVCALGWAALRSRMSSVTVLLDKGAHIGKFILYIH